MFGSFLMWNPVGGLTDDLHKPDNCEAKHTIVYKLLCGFALR